MKKVKQFLSLLLVLLIFVTGCGNSRNMLSEVPSSQHAGNDDTTEESSSKEKPSDNEEPSTDLPVNSGDKKPNYNFSIYDDGRTFSAAQIAVQSDFEDFLSKTFNEEMTANSINLHFSIENPEAYGIEKIPATWGDLDFADISENIEDLNNALHELSEFDYSSLTYEQQLIYDIFKSYIENELAATDCHLFSSAFAPMSGVHSELPIIFSEYDFLERADIDDYLTLLGTSYEYVKAACDYELYRLDNGYSLSAYGLQQVIDQCQEFIDAEPNCLRPVFEEDLNAFNGISQEDIDGYMDKFDKAIEEQLIPAYKLIIETMETLKEANACKGGLANYENGADYYKYLVRYNTGSDLDPDAMYKKIEAKQKEYLNDFMNLFTKNPDIYEQMENFEYPSDDPDEMLKLLINALKEDFPAAVNSKYTLNYVPESLENMMNPAYYIVPPIDNINKNNIYINNNPDYSGMDLFPTIAHEGLPGHMYQSNYFNSLKPHYFRSLISFNGYVEGWAHYVENSYSYKYAGMSEDLAEAMGINSYLSFSLYCMCDLGINYKSWTYDDTTSYLAQYFELTDDVVEEIYYTMVDEPGVYLRYYVGALEIIGLKEAAMEALGTAFDIKEFHRFILEVGPCQFDIIEKRMEDWIKRVK